MTTEKNIHVDLGVSDGAAVVAGLVLLLFACPEELPIILDLIERVKDAIPPDGQYEEEVPVKFLEIIKGNPS